MQPPDSRRERTWSGLQIAALVRTMFSFKAPCKSIHTTIWPPELSNTSQPRPGDTPHQDYGSLALIVRLPHLDPVDTSFIHLLLFSLFPHVVYTLDDCKLLFLSTLNTGFVEFTAKDKTILMSLQYWESYKVYPRGLFDQYLVVFLNLHSDICLTNTQSPSHPIPCVMMMMMILGWSLCLRPLSCCTKDVD